MALWSVNQLVIYSANTDRIHRNPNVVYGRPCNERQLRNREIRRPIFSELGAKVVVVARREDEGNAFVQEMRDSGGYTTFFRADDSLPEDVLPMGEKTLGTYGMLDIAFNNAGVLAGIGPLHEIEEFRPSAKSELKLMETLDRQSELL